MNKCLTVKATSHNTIRCTMNDGRILDYVVSDLEHFATELIRPLKDPRYFRRVFLDAGAPTWPNGYDICPDYLSQAGKFVGRVKAEPRLHARPSV